METLQVNSGVIAKNAYENSYLKDIFIHVNAHLLNGSIAHSCWLSCSNDFVIDVEEYSLPQNGINSRRNNIAVIVCLMQMV